MTVVPASLILCDLLEKIEDGGVFEASQNLFVGKEPQEPTDCITLYDYGQMSQNPNLAYVDSMVQIRARGCDYVETYVRLNKCVTALTSHPPFVSTTTINKKDKNSEVDDSEVIGIWNTSSITAIGQDPNDHYILTANFKVCRELGEHDRGHRRASDQPTFIDEKET